MGKWQLEIFKMGIYMAFPVGLFYVFNQPKFFEEWVITKKRECFQPADPAVEQQLKDCISSFKTKKREELVKELAAISGGGDGQDPTAS
uniref:Protein PET100 homolog, mitochondrial n=1 Tax=Amblyomma maculatum TaxID=34609 RepID=G3MQJ1_AMBMU